MTPDPAILRAVERYRRHRDRADALYRTALVDAIDSGHSYRTVATHAGLSVGRVHEIVAAERARTEVAEGFAVAEGGIVGEDGATSTHPLDTP